MRTSVSLSTRTETFGNFRLRGPRKSTEFIRLRCHGVGSDNYYPEVEFYQELNFSNLTGLHVESISRRTESKGAPK